MTFLLKATLVGAAAISLAACGGNDSAETKPPAPSEPAKIEKVETPAPTQAPETATPAATPTATPTGGSPEFADLPEPYKSADYARGKRQFRTCNSCHLLEADAGNLVGPNLHGMFNRGVAELEGFSYSKALQDADFQWTAEKLDEWLANPRGFLPGNNMSFTGVRRERDRQAVIAYLLVETNK